MKPITAELVEQLKAKHGDDLHHLAPYEHGVICKAPDRAQFERFTAKLSENRNNTGPIREKLCRDVIVHPELAEVDALFDRRPGLITTFSNQISEIAGLEQEAHAKKL